MNAWRTGSTVPRDEAQAKIEKMAADQGIKGPFKVFYNNEIVTDPEDLPEQVDMSKVKVSAVMNQA